MSVLLFGEFGAKFLFLVGDKLSIAGGINEWTYGPRLQARLFLFHVQITAVGTQKNITRE